MSERESLLNKREEQMRGDGVPKTDQLRDEISALENKILSLQDVRQNLMNKQMAELDLVDFGSNLFFGGTN